MYCTKKLFSDDQVPGLLGKVVPIIKKNRDKSVQEVYNLIVDMLNNQESFPFGEGISGQSYIDSINFLRESLISVIQKPVEKLMGTDKYPEFKRLFNTDFMSKAGITSGSVILNTDPETPYMENNPDMTDEDERIRQKLDNIVTTYYGTISSANKYRKQQFGLDLIKHCIIDTDRRVIVRSNIDLNRSICTLKNKYLENILTYIQSNDPNFKATPRIFGDDFKILPGYEQVLNRFYNILKQNKNDIENLVLTGWKKKLVGESDLFYDALNSYVNLVCFDSILEDSIGKVIQLTDLNYSGFELDAQYGKYKFSQGDEHKRKGFQNSENRNALNDIAKFSKLVLSIIPVYSTTNGRFLNRYVNIGNFANAITSLFTNVNKIKDSELKQAITNFHFDPAIYSDIIFRKISNSDIQNQLISSGLNRFDINILSSVFKYVYDTSNPKSIRSIESESVIEQATYDGYSIIDCINGVIDRTMEAAYYQTVHSTTSDTIESSIKKKFSNRSQSYNIVNRINNTRKPIEIRENLSINFPIVKEDLTLLERKRIVDTSCQTYSIKIGNNAIVGISKSRMGILDAQDINIKFSNPRMKEILHPTDNTIDLISKTSIEHLLNGTDLSEDEQLFKDVLNFIDSFLGLKLLTSDGLNKLFIYKSISESDNYLERILESAVRAAVINDLYFKFNKALQDGKYKSEEDFVEFLKEEYVPFKNIDFKNYQETKDFFLNKLGTSQLITVRTSEEWIDQLANIESIISGEVSKSVTSDITGNKIANNRTSFLGGNLQYYLSKYKVAGQNTATSPLLFTRDNSLVVRTVFNTDAESRTGIKKNVRNMKASELFYQSIVYNFYGNYLQDAFNSKKFSQSKNPLYRTLLTQPTTFSDKVTFVMYAINANKPINVEGKSYDDKTIWELNTDQLIDLYQDTIGAAYINLYSNVLDDLRTVLDLPGASFEQINEALHNISENELLSKADAKGIEIQLDTHYRKFGGVCKFNELLYHYATDLYTDRESLVRRFNLEKINFVNDLLSSGVNFYTNYNDDSDEVVSGNIPSQNLISKIIDQMYPDNKDKQVYTQQWVKNKKLVIAKLNGQPVLSGVEIDVRPGDVLELNPLLEKYFYTDSLLSNNMRFELTGSEVAHPDKSKINYTEELDKIGITRNTNPEYFKLNKKGQYVAIDNFNDLIWLKNQSILHPILKSIYDNAIIKTEAVAQGTQLKRNVIIPATLQYEQQNSITGIPPKLKVAIIKDTQASIFNFRGENDTEDAHDGSAYINPLVSILENKALQDQEVGVDKKPIWHSYNPRLMSATLLKFATFTMTNERMRTSLNSDISLYKLFKQMTNLQWSEDIRDEYGNIIGKKWNNSRNAEFDLITTRGLNGSIISDSEDSTIFFDTILAGKPLFYEENGNHFQILNFGRDENGYFTIEAEVNALGSRRDSEHNIKVYHKFDENSNHRKFRDSIPVGENLHDINSLFELFNTMGGIYSEELVESEEGKKQFKYNDASSFAVVNFMNNVSIKIGDGKISQSNYYQPLKEMMIAYAANKSAVKNGISNLNSEKAWEGNTPLRYMTLDSDGLGIQMDADHEIDEAEMTEFSQVISALEAGGRLHHLTRQVYKALGELAIRASNIEINATIEYIKAKNSGLSTAQIRSELYDILGRSLINNYKQQEDRVDLAAPVIAEIKRKFNLNEDHSFDEFKIPFSDPNLYSQTISSFVSSINKKSIKRKYPGSGCVMVPGYNIIQTYKYNGAIKQFDDVLKEAREVQYTEKFFRNFNPEVEDIQEYNKSLVQAYLSRIQRIEWEKATPSIEEFMPTDIVDVLSDDGRYITTIDLNDIGTYYAFKGYSEEDPDGNNAEVTRRGLIGNISGIDISNIKNFVFSINVTRPRNLAPVRIKWKYIDANGNTHTTNIFDTTPIRYSFLRKNDSTYKVNRRLIQQTFDELEKAFSNPDRETWNGFKVVPGSLENLPAELVLSNMYATKFNTKGRSLDEIISTGPDFFKTRTIKTIDSDNYDLVFTTNNGQHTYISFRPLKSDDSNALKPKNVGWKYTKTITENGIEYVYNTTQDGQLLFKVGQNIIREDVAKVGNDFIYKDTNEIIENPNFRVNYKGQIVEYKEFVSNWKVIEPGQKGKLISYNLYVINSQEKAAEILNNIYDTRNYNGIRLNYTMPGTSALIISEVIPQLRVNDSLKRFITLMQTTYLNDIDPEKEFTIDQKKYNKDLKDYYNEFINEIYSSFIKSLTFTASRIPAQTLQSFMQMKAVGLTQSSKNIAYVSHWQTW